jgi:hypothetical protein
MRLRPPREKRPKDLGYWIRVQNHIPRWLRLVALRARITSLPVLPWFPQPLSVPRALAVGTFQLLQLQAFLLQAQATAPLPSVLQ